MFHSSTKFIKSHVNVCAYARVRACVNDNTSIYSLKSFIGRKTRSRGDNMYGFWYASVPWMVPQPTFAYWPWPSSNWLFFTLSRIFLIRMAHLKSNDIRKLHAHFVQLLPKLLYSFITIRDWLVNNNSILMINRSFGCAEDRSIIENWIRKSWMMVWRGRLIYRFGFIKNSQTFIAWLWTRKLCIFTWVPINNHNNLPWALYPPSARQWVLSTFRTVHNLPNDGKTH